MCGIVGIVGQIAVPLERAVLEMRDVFPYRGPDAKGLWTSAQDGVGVGLGHRRLSILDVSDAGTQPMHNTEGGLHVVYNGEVYNYLELLEELQGKGYTFRSKTDTEVLLAAFQHWGPECLQRFNGMWAIAIWDDKARSLFLARDRLGIKPLYYYQSPTALYFASEIKAILPVLPQHPEVTEGLIDAYMTFGYVPGEDTLLGGIKRLLPGHYLLWRDNQVETHQYWDVRFEVGADQGLAHYLQQGREILNDSVNLRLRSDVPLGILLSGGLDSSAVVGLLAPRVPMRLKTFSVAYDFGAAFNETPYARMVAAKFNTEHHEVVVRPEQFRDFIPQYVWLMDEPVTEAAAISLYFVSRLAQDHVTVVLSGEGADEIFAGYDLYRYMQVLERYRHIIGTGGAKWIARIAGQCLPATNKLRKYIALAAAPLDKRYKGISAHDEHYKESLYRREFAEHLASHKDGHPLNAYLDGLFASVGNSDPLGRMLKFDTKTWLPDDLLIKADRMSMAASLELRVPFLDYRLVEFAARMPSRYKINGSTHKFLLKEMMKGILPDEILHRKKMGFPTPLKAMFAHHLQDYCRETLLSGSAKICRYMQRHRMEALLAEHSSGRFDHHRIIWQLLVFEQWLQQFSCRR